MKKLKSSKSAMTSLLLLSTSLTVCAAGAIQPVVKSVQLAPQFFRTVSSIGKASKFIQSQYQIGMLVAGARSVAQLPEATVYLTTHQNRIYCCTNYEPFGKNRPNYGFLSKPIHKQTDVRTSDIVASVLRKAGNANFSWEGSEVSRNKLRVVVDRDAFRNSAIRLQSDLSRDSIRSKIAAEYTLHSDDPSKGRTVKFLQFQSHLTSIVFPIMRKFPIDPDAPRFPLGRRIVRTKIFHAIPNTVEKIKRVYDLDRSASVPNDAVQYLSEAVGKLSDVKAKEAESKDTFLSEIFRLRGPTLTLLLCHNDKGKLRFLDGSWIALDAFERHIRKYNQNVFVLTCNSEPYLDYMPGTNKPLEFDVITSVAKSTHNFTWETYLARKKAGDHLPRVAMSEVILHMDTALSQEQQRANAEESKRRFKVLGKVIGGGTLTGAGFASGGAALYLDFKWGERHEAKHKHEIKGKDESKEQR